MRAISDAIARTGDLMTISITASEDRSLDVARICLAAFVAIYVFGAFAVNPQSFISLVNIYANKFLTAMPIVFVVAVGSAALIRGRGEPTRYAINLLRERRESCLVVLGFLFVSLMAYNAYKLAIPSITPYHADRWLADLDEWLHGAPPWELAHRLDSELWSSVVFNAYDVIWFFQWFGTFLVLSLWSGPRTRLRYLWSAALTFSIVGTVMACALASVGPMYYQHFLGDDRFHGLAVALERLPLSTMITQPAAYLLSTYQSGRADLGGGISAMPSVHVAFAALNAFLMTSLNRWLGLLGWSFAALILYGSVYTGWHYAVDGYVSIAVVSLIWWVTGRFVAGADSAQAEPG